MTLYCSLITKNILNCNFPNRPLFLLPLEICICPPFCPAALPLQSFILFTWQTPTCYLNSLILGSILCFPETQSVVPRCFPYDNPHLAIYQHLYRSFMITFTCLIGVLNELNLALFSPPNAVKHWLISLLPGNIWGIAHCFTVSSGTNEYPKSCFQILRNALQFSISISIFHPILFLLMVPSRLGSGRGMRRKGAKIYFCNRCCL